MKVRFSEEEYEILNDLLEDFLENPPRKYKKQQRDLRKFEEKIELEYIEILNLFLKYKENIKNIFDYEKAISYQLGLMRGLEICGISEDEMNEMDF